MLSSLKNIFKVPDLRNKVLFTLFIIVVYEVGANVIVPYVNFSAIQQIEASAKSAGILATSTSSPAGASSGWPSSAWASCPTSPAPSSSSSSPP